jgi:hypothetical protein
MGRRENNDRNHSTGLENLTHTTQLIVLSIMVGRKAIAVHSTSARMCG